MNRTLSFFLAAILIGLGYYMLVATHTRQETRYKEEMKVRDELKYKLVEPTKGQRAATGAGLGAVFGGGVAAAVGGVGIAVAGTGIGLPAGAVLIGVGALLGGATGATVGAATGDSATYALYTAKVPYSVMVPYTVESVEKSYPGNLGLVVLGLGVFVLGCVTIGYLADSRRRNAGFLQ